MPDNSMPSIRGICLNCNAEDICLYTRFEAHLRKDMDKKKKLIIGTRGSELALWQARHLQDTLKSIGQESELSIIKTKGDNIQNLGFDKLEGKGFFTKEIEEALNKGQIDVAVHSLKDLPTESPEDLVIAGLSYREDPADLLIINKQSLNPNSPLKLHDGAVVGTSSIRRKVQIKHFLPSVELKDLRGNVPTRIKKLESGVYDAIIIAHAGVNRIEADLGTFHCIRLNPKEFVPAPAQGVIGFQVRKEDLAARALIDAIHKREVARCTNVERKVLKLMAGGCQIPLGVYCEQDPMGHFHIHAAYSEGLNSELKKVSISQSTSYMLAEKIIEELKK